MSRPPLNFSAIESATHNNVERCLHYLVNGKKQGNEFVCLNPRREDKHLGSFSYNLRSHVWSEFATGEGGGGIISFWEYVRGVDYYTAAAELSAWLGLGDTVCIGGDYKSPYYERTPPKVSKPSNPSQYIDDLWSQSNPAEDTVVETYLRFRGFTGIIPPSIRCLSDHWHKEKGQKFPVMISAVYRGLETAKPVALHRTFLRHDGNGKADVEPDKKMIGSTKGCAVQLSAPAEKMVVGEGIETCLSVQQSCGLPTWAALSTSGLLNLVLPPLPYAQEIIIAADNDAAGINAAAVAARRWKLEGRKVKIAKPQTVNDFNDILGENQ